MSQNTPHAPKLSRWTLVGATRTDVDHAPMKYHLVFETKDKPSPCFSAPIATFDGTTGTLIFVDGTRTSIVGHAGHYTGRDRDDIVAQAALCALRVDEFYGHLFEVGPSPASG